MVMGKSEVVDLLKSEVVDIEFTKVNGEVRHMTCTLRESSLPKREDSPKGKVDNPDVLAVFDTINQGWRSFRWDSLKTINGVKYE